MIGWAETDDLSIHAFLWDRVKGMQDLGEPCDGGSSAFAISDRSQVVGWFEADNGENHAFLWDPYQGWQDLGTLGGPWSVAFGINDSGQVVGYSATEMDEIHPFLWDQLQGMQDLNTLLVANSDWLLQDALDINKAGQIVGSGWINGNRHAFKADPSRGLANVPSDSPSLQNRTS